MTRIKRRSTALSYRIVFFVGAAFVLLGVIGLLFKFVGSRQFVLADTIHQDVLAYVDFKVNKDAQKVLSTLEGKDSFIEKITSYIPLSGNVRLEDWVEKRVFVGMYEENEFVFAFPKKRGRDAQAFIQAVALSDESVNTFSVQNQMFYTPAYSSFITATNMNGYVVVVSSKALAQKVLMAENPLGENDVFRDVLKNVPRSSFAKVYVSSEEYTDLIQQKYPEYGPLFDVVSTAMPAGMISFREEKEALAVHMNIHTAEGVFAETEKAKRPRQTLPALAHFAPKDVLFFMNGVDISYKYTHTKQFLSRFHPQFALFFEGIIQAESQTLFGDDFDVETDLLQALNGQYATIVHGFPQTALTLISDVEAVDRDQMLSQFHAAIHSAQSRFSTKTVEIELPDGTTRQELVALDPQEVAIETSEHEGIEYFVAEGVSAEQAFSYGIIDRYFVFSSHESGMKSLISAYKETSERLSDNTDFRESVLFSFSPSESYGFVNIAGWKNVVTSLQGLLDESETSSLGALSSFFNGIRTASFARKVYEDQVITDVQLFFR